MEMIEMIGARPSKHSSSARERPTSTAFAVVKEFGLK
jgi:hypothetical protein